MSLLGGVIESGTLHAMFLFGGRIFPAGQLAGGEQTHESWSSPTPSWGLVTLFIFFFFLVFIHNLHCHNVCLSFPLPDNSSLLDINCDRVVLFPQAVWSTIHKSMTVEIQGHVWI